MIFIVNIWFWITLLLFLCNITLLLIIFQVLKMLVMIVILFCLCWLPIQVFGIVVWLFPLKLTTSTHYLIYVISYFVCHWLSMAHSKSALLSFPYYSTHFLCQPTNKLLLAVSESVRTFKYSVRVQLRKHMSDIKRAIRWYDNHVQYSTIQW